MSSDTSTDSSIFNNGQSRNIRTSLFIENESPPMIKDAERFIDANGSFAVFINDNNLNTTNTSSESDSIVFHSIIEERLSIRRGNNSLSDTYPTSANDVSDYREANSNPKHNSDSSGLTNSIISQATHQTEILEERIPNSAPEENRPDSSGTISTTELNRTHSPNFNTHSNSNNNIHNHNTTEIDDSQNLRNNTSMGFVKMESTPLRKIALTRDQEKSRSSLFKYDEAIEPDIEEAVKLLKNDMHIDRTQMNKIQNGAIEGNSIRYNQIEEDKRKSDEFKPHEFLIMGKKESTASLLSFSDGSTAHSPRSPSIINKVFIKKDMYPSPLNDIQEDSFSNEPLLERYGDIIESERVSGNINRLSGGIPKIPVLRRVSGPSRWIKTSPGTELGSSPGFTLVSTPLTSTPRNKTYRLSFSRSIQSQRSSFHYYDDEDEIIPNKRNSMMSNKRNSMISNKRNSMISNKRNSMMSNKRNSVFSKHDSILSQQESVVNHRESMMNPQDDMVYSNNSSLLDLEANNYYNDDVDYDGNLVIEHDDVPIQRVHNSSVESFDSQELKFKDIYSFQRILVTIMICMLCPVFFFMIGFGKKAGVNDYRLMKMILNREHRFGLLKGFIWDIRVSWFRNICLMIGIVEILVIGMFIGVGVGVGLHRE